MDKIFGLIKKIFFKRSFSLLLLPWLMWYLFFSIRNYHKFLEGYAWYSVVMAVSSNIEYFEKFLVEGYIFSWTYVVWFLAYELFMSSEKKLNISYVLLIKMLNIHLNSVYKVVPFAFFSPGFSFFRFYIFIGCLRLYQYVVYPYVIAPKLGKKKNVEIEEVEEKEVKKSLWSKATKVSSAASKFKSEGEKGEKKENEKKWKKPVNVASVLAKFRKSGEKKKEIEEEKKMGEEENVNDLDEIEKKTEEWTKALGVTAALTKFKKGIEKIEDENEKKVEETEKKVEVTPRLSFIEDEEKKGEDEKFLDEDDEDIEDIEEDENDDLLELDLDRKPDPEPEKMDYTTSADFEDILKHNNLDKNEEVED